MTYSIEKVTTLIGARRYGDRDTNIGFLLTDSRSLCFPEETLFFALKSARNDGHNYISDLYRRGVRNFVVSAVPQNYATDYPEANFLRVINPLEALQRLAERHRDEVNIPIVGITGSNGKTMVKEWLYQVLSPDYVVTRSPRSYTSQIGVPQSVWLIDKNTEVGVFEAGISEPGEMLALRDIIQPTIAVLTNLGAAHQENFYSLEEKCREKLVLFHDAKTVVYDADDETQMRDNNSSSFCYRAIAGTTKLSKHARGLAIDINTLYNPYYKDRADGTRFIQPATAEAYCDRTWDFPYKIDHDDLCFRLFTEAGFEWGGDWTSCKDFQHFELIE